MSDDTLRKNLARLLKQAKRSGRSVSLDAGLSESAIKHILAGRSQSPGVDTISAIAKELGVPPAALTGSDEVPNSSPGANLEGQFVEDQTELRLLRYWRVLDAGERSYLLNLLRLSILGN